jgi:hypothetical protein
MRADPSRALSRIAVAVCVLIAAFIVLDTVATIVSTYSPLLYWDQWDSLLDYQRFRQGDYRLLDLFSTHNEHRPAIPRLIFFADYALAGGTNKLNLAAIFLIQVAHLAMLLALIGPRWRESSTWVVAAAAAALLLSVDQWENFTWGFQSQFVGVFALATGAYILIGKAVGTDGGRRLGFFIAAIVLLFLATFSMANGLIAAAVAILLCLGLRAPWWMTLGAAAYIALAGFAYFHNYHPVSEGSNLATVLSNPWGCVSYFLNYLGNPAGPQQLWSGPGEPISAHRFPQLLGLLGAVLAGMAILLVLLRRETDRVQLVLVAILLFCLATAAVTATGRVNFGIWQAYSSRYRTPTAIFWAALIIFWFRVSWRPILPARRAIAAFAACALIGLIFVQQAAKEEVDGKAISLIRAENALLAQVADINALNGAFPRGGEVVVRAEILRGYHKSIFTEPRAGWLSRDVASIGPLRPGQCRGAFDKAIRSPFGALDGVRGSGWAWDLKAHRAARHIILVNGQGKVVGFGSTGHRRPDVQAALHYPWAINSGWEGVGRASAATLTAYAVLHDGGLCALGTQQAGSLPPLLSIRSLSSADIGPTLGGPARFEGGRAWTVGGTSPAVGPDPAGMTAYGSFSGADSNTGAILFGPWKADQASVAFGVITGPETGGLSLLVRDAVSHEVLGVLYPGKLDAWTWLRVDLPPAAMGRQIEIEVSDHGSAWGQWMGVTEPRRIAASAL